jgi:hypothetical protein
VRTTTTFPFHFLFQKKKKKRVMEFAVEPPLPLVYPVGSSTFTTQFAHINSKISGQALLKLDLERDAIASLSKSSSRTGLLLEKVQSYFSLWRVFCIFVENNRNTVKSLGPSSFRWYVPSLDEEFSSPVFRFETICLCSLYASLIFNTGLETKNKREAKDLFIKAHRICELWKNEILSWTLRDERKLPFEATELGCATTNMFCLLALQRRALNVLYTKIQNSLEKSYGKKTSFISRALLSGTRLCLWWYIAADRLTKNLVSRKMDYPKLNMEQVRTLFFFFFSFFRL